MMSRRTLINLALLVVVLILGAVAWLTPDEMDKAEFQPLTTLNPSEIMQVTIANHNGPGFTLKRGPVGWSMTTPYQVAANTPRINILLDIASTPSFEQHPVPADRLKEFGLDKPRAELLFNDTKLIFGGTHPYNYRRYVLIDDTLHLINDHFPHHFLALAEDFISHSLLGEGAKVREIKSSQWHLYRNQTGWLLEPPVEGISVDQLTAKADEWENTWTSKVQKAPKKQASDTFEIRLQNRPTPLTFDAIRTERELLLAHKELGLAYRLPLESTLLNPPAQSD
ncbi:DUF4340 domain-containing protein [Solemya velesiana gill symbiont]|uniref:DUF4340 domain-containing protein n=1 Tax=Solemya velesiana gill symbiont TaxID=1918948 RepID=A0A1T2KV85_9GAMM|nr:DUF4340 domain-containing protein [Solemya velesiana gill symbiont]OOZ36773.1 hypothetical protein BOW51_05450 [Solemya velesiana gill symbiont]